MESDQLATRKQLAIYAWMLDQWQREQSPPEPDLGESLRRVQQAEEQHGKSFATMLTEALAEQCGLSLTDYQQEYIPIDGLWKWIKQGRYRGPSLDAALQKLPREMRLTQRQFRKILPLLNGHEDRIGKRLLEQCHEV